MTEARELDLAFGVLDHQLVDEEGRRCGKVDDLELDGGPGKALRVTTILAGTSYWAERFPAWARPLARRLGGSRARIPWSVVGDVEAAVHLTARADELGLGRGDDRLRRWIERLPGS